jgi:hypothetical protein
MKIWSRTPTAGVVTPLAGKRPGTSSASGCGTSALSVGASACSRSGAHHRVCSRSPACAQRGGPLACSLPGVWTGRSGPPLESWPLLGARLCSPARWHAPLPRRSVAGCTRAAYRGRWEPAHRLCGQHPQLSPLPSTGTVSMAGQRCHQASSGQCAPASPRRRVCAPALERLESAAPSTGVHTSAPSATCGGAGRAGPLCQPRSRAPVPVPCTARACSSRLI